ncbi:MAG: hypothetical protein LBE85_09420 [Candidatus Accumulibacter sp.]|nr:hypothetical protein [Accumulibacter sp.]
MTGVVSIDNQKTVGGSRTDILEFPAAGACRREAGLGGQRSFPDTDIAAQSGKRVRAEFLIPDFLSETFFERNSDPRRLAPFVFTSALAVSQDQKSELIRSARAAGRMGFLIGNEVPPGGRLHG